MNVQERIAKLEALLERIRSNAARPRQAVASLFGMRAAEPTPAAAPARPVGQPAAAAPARPVGQPAPAAPARPAAPAPSPEPPPSLEIVTDVEDLEGIEAEIVEIAAAESADLGELQIEEAAPESAPRPAAHVEPEEIPPPIKTPPPESGRQAVTPPPPAAAGYAPDDLEGAADVDALLEADLSGGTITARGASTPTVEQVGQTVDLESAEAATDLELATLPPEPIPPSDELELALPKGGRAGAYEPSLEPPPEARSDLERHRRAREELRGAPPARVEARAAPVSVTEPQVTERPPAPAAAAAEFVAPPPAEGPKTFLELLDASLRLG